MCRHCRLDTVDDCDRELVHKFMEVATKRLNQRLVEKGSKRVLTADEIDMAFEINEKEVAE